MVISNCGEEASEFDEYYSAFGETVSPSLHTDIFELMESCWSLQCLQVFNDTGACDLAVQIECLVSKIAFVQSQIGDCMIFLKSRFSAPAVPVTEGSSACEFLPSGMIEFNH